MHAEGYCGLRLIIMSATIDANRIAQFFCNPDTGEPAAILHVGKQPFEVQSFHSDALREALPADFPKWKEHAPSRSSQAARLDPAMYDAACYLIRALGDGTIEAALPGALSDAELEAQEASQHGGNGLSGSNGGANQSLGHGLGAVLIFVPGQAEIYELLHAISGGSAGVDPRWIQLVPLHSLLDDDAQRTAFAPAPAGMRKVRQTPDAGRQTDSRSICRSCRPIAQT
jgi:HrpA-like RNA helicase